MTLASQEANRFNHPFIGDEHILLGLVKEGEGIGAFVLRSLNVDLSALRQEVEKLGGRGLPALDGLKRVITYAAEESEQLHHDHVGTEHLLLGLLRHAEGAGATALKAVGVDLAKAREEVLATLKSAAVDTETPQSREEALAGLTDRHAGHPLVQRYRALLQELRRERDAAIDQKQYEIAVFHRDAAAAIERLLWQIVTHLQQEPGAEREGPKDG
jgi:ATP-dependent Clp protease ATP-binding subunit ClpC